MFILSFVLGLAANAQKHSQGSFCKSSVPIEKRRCGKNHE